MAEVALVTFLIEQLAPVILEELRQEVSLVVGVQNEIQKLLTTFSAIKIVLSDAEQQQIKDKLVKLWLEKFKDVAYEMEDVLDEWNTQIQRSRNGNNQVSSYLCSLFSCINEVDLRHNIGFKIKQIRERLDLIEDERNKYRFKEVTSNNNDIERLPTSSVIDLLDVRGRDKDKETIVSKLLGESSSTQHDMEIGPSLPFIISIVGMGGLGKTTLAQMAFNDQTVKEHFEKTIWVCVSDPFDLTRLAKAIIQEAGGTLPDSSEWNALHHSLCNSVKGKRFLLVLDDVWSYDQSKWDQLKLSLKQGAQGSRVLVTTRDKEVAIMMDTTYIHDLQILSNEECWSLFSKISFSGRKKEEQENLKEIGFKLAKKCKGLPLSAKTLASLLRFKKNKSDWQSVLENEVWESEKVGGVLIPALLLSYYHLPSPLKACFTYCSIFPKDCKIKKDKLIRLWMAQGFLYSSERREEMETIGEEYFDNLRMRSFFQNLYKDDKGNIIFFTMHDLVHDLAQFLTKKESINIKGGSDMTEFINHSSKARHLNIMFEDEELINSLHASMNKARNLRTFIYKWNTSLNAPCLSLPQIRCLRVLTLKYNILKKLPNEIGKLIHLRYLNLSRNIYLKELPKTLTDLHNLQMLKLKWCISLRKLPKDMMRMTNLRHLDLRYTHLLQYIPKGIGNLRSLRTLSKFIVGPSSVGCEIGELKDLKHLQGRCLSIGGLGRVKSVEEACEIQLKEMQHVDALELDFKGAKDVTKNAVIERIEGILQVLQPHPKLLELTLKRYIGYTFPSWIMDEALFSHLRKLRIECCHNFAHLPALGQLPSLERLELEYCELLEELPCLLPITLKVLKIGICPKLTWGPATVDSNSLPPPPPIEELALTFDAGVFSRFSLSIFPNLKSLSLYDPPEISTTFNSLSELKLLRRLVISKCSLKCMPQDVRLLSELQLLMIEGCDSLGRRCQRNGEDWKIISHIPDIYIDRKWIKH